MSAPTTTRTSGIIAGCMGTPSVYSRSGRPTERAYASAAQGSNHHRTACMAAITTVTARAQPGCSRARAHIMTASTQMKAAPTSAGSTAPIGSSSRATTTTTPNATRVAVPTIAPIRPQRWRRAAVKTVTDPAMVIVTDSRKPMCGGEAIVASKPYRPCHHWSHSPYSRNSAAPDPEIR
ncbi:hypothetical protein [Streptomyces sp. NPDC059881]|uniref:hypothetical protein n=1 Tax=Streptomyces sp. NPDC059881 TaxID=3346986 RepID=UPI0036535BCC